MGAPEGIDVRILADDLTGALDSAVSFAGAKGIDVSWRADAVSRSRAAALDLATREADETTAVARNRAAANWLSAASIRFKKIDSLLRGHVAAEIRACLQAAPYDRVVLAPAFPFQARVTREGRQWRLRPDAAIVETDLKADLAKDFDVAVARPGEDPDTHLVIYDAETDGDLDRIVASRMPRSASTLWVGAGGLASALGRHLQIPVRKPMFAMPLLALFGSNHPVTASQISRFNERFAEGHIELDGDVSLARRHLAKRMADGAPTLVTVLVKGSREAAARQIERSFADLLRHLPVSGPLLVTGGETLRGICDSLAADWLTAVGELEPGLPVSRVHGGTLDGVTVISKSGAFGEADLLLRLSGSLGASPRNAVGG